MSTKHTQDVLDGFYLTPWSSVEIGVGGMPGYEEPIFEIMSANQRRIATVAGGPRARLIAAAPDLLAALERVIEVRALTVGGEVYKQARAAIAKATGN